MGEAVGESVVRFVRSSVEARARQQLLECSPPIGAESIYITVGLSAPLLRAVLPGHAEFLSDGTITVAVALDCSTIREWKVEDADRVIIIDGDLRVVLDDDIGWTA